MKLAATAVGGQEGPDSVRMARQHLRAAVPEMRRQRRAGRDRGRRFEPGVAAVWPSATRTPRATRYSISSSAPGHFRRERDEHDPSVGGFLTTFKIVSAPTNYVIGRMRPSRPVLGRDVRALPCAVRRSRRACERASSRAFRANASSGPVMSVGRQRVTPVRRSWPTASRSASGWRSGALKSTPAKPLTCRSKKPGKVYLILDRSRAPRRVSPAAAATRRGIEIDGGARMLLEDRRRHLGRDRSLQAAWTAAALRSSGTTQRISRAARI